MISARNIEIPLLLAVFGVMFNLASMPVLLPSIAKYFSLSASSTGNIIPEFMFGYFLGALCYSTFLANVGVKRLMVIFTGCLFLSNIILIISPFKIFLVMRFITGFCSSIFVPLGISLLSEKSEEAKKGKVVGRVFAVSTLANISGIVLTGFLPWKMFFGVPALIAFLVLLWSCTTVFPSEMGKKNNILKVFKLKNVNVIYSYILIVRILSSAIYAWLAVYLYSNCGYNKEQTAILYLVISIATVVGSLIGGRLNDIFGSMLSMKLFSIGLGLSIILVLNRNIQHPVWIGTLCLFFGFFKQAFHVVLVSVLTEVNKLRNVTLGFNSVVVFLGNSLGSFFIKEAVKSIDFPVVTDACGIFVLIISASFFIGKNNLVNVG